MAQMFVCKNCGITFRGKASKKPQHCSRECYKATAAKRQERTCDHCGKKFRVNTSTKEGKFCSRECSGLAQRALVTCTCEQCGVQFQKRPGDRKKYCTHKCFFDAQRGQERPSMKGRVPPNAKERPPRDVLCELYEGQQLSPIEIGSRFGVQSQTICTWLHDASIPVRSAQETTQFKPGPRPDLCKEILDEATMKLLYLDWKMTTRQIGEHYQVSSTTVGKWLKHHGISMRPAGTGLARRGIVAPTAAELERMIHVEHLYYRQVAERYGVDQSAVMHWLDRHGIERPKTWHERHNNQQDVAAMQALYEEGLSLDDIGIIYGVSYGPVTLLFQEHGIQIRPAGWRADVIYQTKDGLLVRSSYEQRVANWLVDNGIAYTYEPRLPFPGLSDFLANNWYIEVWGVDSPRYQARKAIKQAQYRAHGLPLIEIPYYAFSRQRNSLWERRLASCLIAPN